MLVEKKNKYTQIVLIVTVIVGLVKLYGHFSNNPNSNLGKCHTLFTQESYAEAIDFCHISSDKGNAGSSLLLGKIYADGLDTKKNFKLAKSEYLKAIQSELEEISTSGMMALGDLYKDNEFSEFNMTDSFKWFKSAADKGNAYSQMMVGAFFITGQGGELDLAHAKEYLRKAAKNGQEKANELLISLESE